MTDFGPLFAPPPPPTGPESDVPTGEANHYRAYVAWRYTADGLRVWQTIEFLALEASRRGVRRVSINALHEEARRILRVPMNNTYRPWLADDLIARHPELLDVIERRRRRKAKVA